MADEEGQSLCVCDEGERVWARAANAVSESEGGGFTAKHGATFRLFVYLPCLGHQHPRTTTSV